MVWYDVCTKCGTMIRWNGKNLTEKSNALPHTPVFKRRVSKKIRSCQIWLPSLIIFIVCYLSTNFFKNVRTSINKKVDFKELSYEQASERFIQSTKVWDRDRNIIQNPNMRIILIVNDMTNSSRFFKEDSEVEHLENILFSLQQAYYDSDSIDLDVHILPHQQISISTKIFVYFEYFRWSHGKFRLINSSSSSKFEEVLGLWTPSSGSTDSVSLIHLERSTPFQKNWYRFVSSAKQKYCDIPYIFAVSPTLYQAVNEFFVPSDFESNVLLGKRFVDNGIICPCSVMKWRVFQNWFQRERNNWYLWPSLPEKQNLIKIDRKWDNFNATMYAAWPHWISRFSVHYHLFTLYPSSRNPAGIPAKSVDVKENNKDLFKLDIHGSSVKDKGIVKVSNQNIEKIVQFSKAYDGVVSITIVNEHYLETARSWICNVNVGNFAPPGIVWITLDKVSFENLANVSGSHAVLLEEFNGGINGATFGKPGYWLLMLERAFLIRDLLNRGLTVFLFETDQVWLRNPLPFINRILSDKEVDLIGTIDAGGSIGGNFLYFKPSLSTRKLYIDVCEIFEKEYISRNISSSPENKVTMIGNDQSILSRLVLYDEIYRLRFPVVFRVLDTERFVCGKWYDKILIPRYSTVKGRSPVMINNNWVKGVNVKKARLKVHGHWFFNDNMCDKEAVLKAISQNEKRLSPDISTDTPPTLNNVFTSIVVEGEDVEADTNKVITSIT